MINFLFQKGAKSMWKNLPDKNGFSMTDFNRGGSFEVSSIKWGPTVEVMSMMTDFKLNPKTENGKIFAFYEEEKFTLLIASSIVLIINSIILYYGNEKSSWLCPILEFFTFFTMLQSEFKDKQYLIWKP